MGLFDSITGAATQFKESAEDLAEKAALVGMGIPPSWVTWYQTERKHLGFGPPSETGRFFLLIVIGILFMIFVGWVYSKVQNFFGLMGRGMSGQLKTKGEVLMFVIVVGAVFTGLIWFFYLQPKLQDTQYDLAKDYASKLGIQSEGFAGGSALSLPQGSARAEGFQTAVAADPDATLGNLQMLAVKHTGFLGPQERNGLFDVETAVQTGLRLGLRTYILQIDMLESERDKKKFPAPGIPTLVLRDSRGTLMSENSGRIEDVAAAFDKHGFHETVPTPNYPLILYLHFNRTPNQLREPEKYVQFMSTVAKGLEPLFKYHLNVVAEGGYQRQQMEAALLKMPLLALDKKVLFFSNADLSLFRQTTKLGLGEFEPKHDLDYLVNMRVYLSPGAPKLGITEAAPTGRPVVGLLTTFEQLAGLSDADQDAFAKAGRDRFVITMPASATNPSKGSIETVLERTGPNVLALNFFGEEIGVLKQKIGIWKGSPATKLKPPVLRSQGGALPIGAMQS